MRGSPRRCPVEWGEMGWRKRDLGVGYRRIVTARPFDKPCVYCGRAIVPDDPMRQPTRDHIHPKALGGSNSYRNLVWCCFACNNLKGDMTLREWHVVMQKVPEWWLLADKKGPRGKNLLTAMAECGFDVSEAL